MRSIKKLQFLFFGLLFLNISQTNAQLNDSSFYSQVKTYLNPVLPGDHPDPTLLKHGDDFYHCGSSFHFNPYLPIYHSKDLVHWEIISRVVPPANASMVSDQPGAGIWQGALTYFYGSFWVYFSAGGQWFCKANSPNGPWSAPQKMQTTSDTGPIGYDNSVFVDEDGKPYMIIKNGQHTNRIQEIGKDGNLTSHVMDLDWINSKDQYSWAEGPVMFKRNGFYYYTMAGDVSGGQYILKGSALTGDSTRWERLGNFFKPITDNDASFRRPNHVAAPIQLADGTWWTIGQSYQLVGNNDWSGQGRQTSLYQVVWDGDRPWGVAPTNSPNISPNLPQANIPWRSTHSDYFNNDSLGLWWHFLNKEAFRKYSLSDRKGWLRLIPDSSRSHIVQKETDHYYSAVTKVDLNATNDAHKAGIYITNGNQSIFGTLYTGFKNGKKIIFNFGDVTYSVPNKIGNILWIKLERQEHNLQAFYSSNGTNWKMLGNPVNALKLDKAQPNFNSWVGTSIGLFAEGKFADFDFFSCKDGFSNLYASGYSNGYGVKKDNHTFGKTVIAASAKGGWLMFSGVDLGTKEKPAKKIAITLASETSGQLEIWLDGLRAGKLLVSIPFNATSEKNKWRQFSKAITNISGQHDVFIKIPEGQGQCFIDMINFSSE